MLPSEPVFMMPIASIRPDHGRPTRPGKPIDPASPYAPMIVDSRGVLQDGYHRYFDLIDSGYRGPVPVVTFDA